MLRRMVWTALMIGICILMMFALGSCQRTQTAERDNSGGKTAGAGGNQAQNALKNERLYIPEAANCGGFTSEDAAEILGVPASKIEMKTEELYSGFWQCSLKGGDTGKSVAFGVTVSKSTRDAVTEMEQYRSHLKTAGEVSPFKENLPNGAYSDIGDLGDDAVWTDMNLSITARKGNVSIQVTLPKDEEIQIKVARKFLSKL